MADTILDTDQIPFLVLPLGAHCTSQEGEGGEHRRSYDNEKGVKAMCHFQTERREAPHTPPPAEPRDEDSPGLSVTTWRTAALGSRPFTLSSVGEENEVLWC